MGLPPSVARCRPCSAPPNTAGVPFASPRRRILHRRQLSHDHAEEPIPLGGKQTHRSYTTPHPQPVIRRSQRPIPRFRQPRKTAMGQPTRHHRMPSPAITAGPLSTRPSRRRRPLFDPRTDPTPCLPAAFTSHRTDPNRRRTRSRHRSSRPPYTTQPQFCQDFTRRMGPVEFLAAQPATPSRPSPRNTSGAGGPTS
jgi:hypothetical protein